MADERCRITVVGERGQVDLAVPAHAPIAEYVPMVAGLCGQPDSDVMPSAWSLAPAGAQPFDPGASLESVGVLDGETLYLRDVLAGELDGPVVAEIDEQIAELGDDGTMWQARARAHTTLGIGLLILFAAAGALCADSGATGAVVAGVPLFAAGLVGALLAWTAGRKSWPVPTALRLAMAAAACPLLAGAVMTLPVPGLATRLVVAAFAASLGAFAAYLAAPSTATMTLQLLCGLVLVLCVVCAVLRVDLVEGAAIVAVVAFLILGTLPRIAAQAAVMPPGPAEMENVERTVRRVQGLLVFLNGVCCLVIAASLVVLSTSGDWFALGLALCLSLALLCRAGSSRLTAIVATVLLSGTAGLVALALRAPGRLLGADAPGWSGPLALIVVGVVVVWSGLALCFRSSLQQVDFGERWRWPGPLAGFLGALSVPLAAGVFGVFGALMRAGGRM
ncbi:EsaB/YukD family protein [Actinoallomurus sp. NPDC052274]|uniref:EsaB/YukD family protein n=1 Tax=Actinoallomurus sp. NPDC052274 TaxID=3155420 RepID=UPI00342E49FB